MSVARLELVQTGDGTIVLRAADADEAAPLSEPEVLLTLRFNERLTELLGADALTLAQSMVVSASHVFEYGVRTEAEPSVDTSESVAGDSSAVSSALSSAVSSATADSAAPDSATARSATALDSSFDVDLELEEESVVRLRTATLH